VSSPASVLLFSRKLIYTTAQLWSWFVCFLYIKWWKFTASVRRILIESIVLILLIAAIALLLELTGTVFGHEFERLHLNWWQKMLILALATLMVWHRVKEWQEAKEESLFEIKVAELLRGMAILNRGSSQNAKEQNLKEFIKNVFISFQDIFDMKPDLHMNIMLPADATNSPNSVLKIMFQSPHSEYEAGVSFPSGEGGVGIAFRDGVMIYLPAIKYLHGIRIVGHHYKLIYFTYSKRDIPGFSSCISVPIKIGNKTVGILNIDSLRQNAFTFYHFDMAEVAAASIGIALDRYWRHP
jgi:GAF domain-containing protein